MKFALPQNPRRGAVRSERSRAARRCWRWGWLALALWLCWLLPGCGGLNGFTGGGVPIGKSRLRGKVLLAVAPRTAISNAEITARVRADGNVFTLRQTTDALGNFDFPDVPTNEVTSEIEVSVTPNNPALRSQQVSFLISNGRQASMVVSLPQFTYDITQPMTVTLTPPLSTLQPGQRVQLDAQIKDSSGTVLSAEPTLIFSDDFGTLAPDGSFMASGAGTGSVIATWYNVQRATASIIVNSPGGSQPPPPP